MKPGTLVRINHGNHRHHGELARVLASGPARKGHRTWTRVLLELDGGVRTTANLRRLTAVRQR